MSTYPQFFPTPDLFSQTGVETLRNVADGTIDSATRLAALQIEAAHAAVNENVKQFRTFLQNTADTSAALSQWSVLFQASAQRFNQMAKYYIESASQDMIDWNRWLGQSMSPFAILDLSHLAPAGGKTARERQVERDRRVAAQLITFPERRASELAKAAASAAAESARQATEAMEEQAGPEADTDTDTDTGSQAAFAKPAEEEAVPQEQVVQPTAAATKPGANAPPRRGGSKRKP